MTPDKDREVLYGGCGVEFCAECLPRFDAENREIQDGEES
jgi:hypothetical protein